MDNFKRFSEKKLPDKKCFYSSVKDGTTGDDSGDDSKKLDGYKSDEDYFTCKSTWNEFNMTNIGDYRDHYLKKGCFAIS